MSDYLIHYGVKGMKWGVRKQRPTSGRSRLHRAYNAQMRDAADLRKHGYKKEADAVEQVAAKTKEKIDRKESNPGMSTKKKVAIAATVVGVASVGTALAIYGKKTYGSLNPRKIAAGRELANRISGRSNDVALKSIKKSYKFTPSGLRNGKASRVDKSYRTLDKRLKTAKIYDDATTARFWREDYKRTGDPYSLSMMRLYDDHGKTPLIPPKKSKIRRR